MTVVGVIARSLRGVAKRLSPDRYFVPNDHVARLAAVRARFSSLDLSRRVTLVLGSAPDSRMPTGIDGEWSIVTANAAQRRLVEWNLPSPNLTIIRANAAGEGALQDEMWEQLRGLGTERMFSAGRLEYATRLGQRARESGYAIGEAILADWKERLLIIYATTGLWMMSRNPELTPTNGVLGILVALWLGAPAVVISGISFSTGGYTYARAGMEPRARVAGDREVIAALIARRAPIFTSDSQFAFETGIPLWDSNCLLRLPPAGAAG